MFLHPEKNFEAEFSQQNGDPVYIQEGLDVRPKKL